MIPMSICVSCWKAEYRYLPAVSLCKFFCRYPQETMDLVKELSEDIAGEYREKQKKKLQRTFVEASEAASSKVKGIKKNCEL